MMYRGTGHNVVIGWTNKSKEMIKQLVSQEKEVVLIDTIEQPFTHLNFHYIKASPVDEKSYKDANLREAQTISIFANNNKKDKTEVDGRTLLIATAVSDYKKDNRVEVFTVVEIVSKKNFRFFKRVKADKYILYDEPLNIAM